MVRILINYPLFANFLKAKLYLYYYLRLHQSPRSTNKRNLFRKKGNFGLHDAVHCPPYDGATTSFLLGSLYAYTLFKESAHMTHPFIMENQYI